MPGSRGLPRPDADRRPDLAERVATNYRFGYGYYAFPAMLGNNAPLHPFLSWWAVLFALSMLARYGPRRWFKLIDVNQSYQSVSIEGFLEAALESIPPLIYNAVAQVSEMPHRI